MELQSRNKIISGIEPVDALLGGLDRGQLYLVHGEASGKSLFGIKFLIEGLKQGENGALVIRYSPEDAVQRFARAGYDCLQDVYSGRLVILEYSDHIIQKIGKLREITPVLRELEWLLGETRPERLIFDPVASVLVDAEGDLDSRANAFAEWARSFGATVVLIANESNPEIINAFQPLVAGSFRFDIRDVAEDAARFMTFENSSAIPDQAIELDSSRDVFPPQRAHVPERAGSNDAIPQPPSMAELESIREELREVRDLTPKGKPERPYEVDLTGDSLNTLDPTLTKTDAASVVSDQRSRDNLKTHRLTPIEEEEFQAPRANLTLQATSASIEELELQFGEPITSAEAAPMLEGQLDELSDLLDDLTSSTSPLDLDLPEAVSPHSEETESITDQANIVARSSNLIAGQTGVADPRVSFIASDKPGSRRKADQAQMRHGRASDLSIDSAMAARAAELLLHPLEGAADLSFPETSSARLRAVHEATQPASADETEVRASDFNVLIIEDDAETCDLLTQTLGDYSVEVVHDGVSGLARLISLKPDLVVLDFDLPIIDGFKVLTLIRSALNVPIIIVSG
ncbi:MAG TPA: ATPase domain-containing protein, partial [Blastocatellia bacterium]|nr:ATPase domain-containing protein [Blastocatellia bacterium]